jgi:hypothetical protein
MGWAPQFETAEDAPETLKSDIAAAGIPESGRSAYTLQESWRALNDANLQHLSLLLHASSCWFRFSQVRRVFVRSTLTRASVRLARPTFLSLRALAVRFRDAVLTPARGVTREPASRQCAGVVLANHARRLVSPFHPALV